MRDEEEEEGVIPAEFRNVNPLHHPTATEIPLVCSFRYIAQAMYLAVKEVRTAPPRKERPISFLFNNSLIDQAVGAEGRREIVPRSILP